MPETIELPEVRSDPTYDRPWKVIVLNDDHNTFDHVAHVLALHLPGVSVSAGYSYADRIHLRGRAIVWSGHRELAEHYRELLGSAGLTMAPLQQD